MQTDTETETYTITLEASVSAASGRHALMLVALDLLSDALSDDDHETTRHLGPVPLTGSSDVAYSVGREG